MGRTSTLLKQSGLRYRTLVQVVEALLSLRPSLIASRLSASVPIVLVLGLVLVLDGSWVSNQ